MIENTPNIVWHLAMVMRERREAQNGDNVRQGLSFSLGFSEDDRRENTRRIG